MNKIKKNSLKVDMRHVGNVIKVLWNNGLYTAKIISEQECKPIKYNI